MYIIILCILLTIPDSQIELSIKQIEKLLYSHVAVLGPFSLLSQKNGLVVIFDKILNAVFDGEFVYMGLLRLSNAVYSSNCLILVGLVETRVNENHMRRLD